MNSPSTRWFRALAAAGVLAAELGMSGCAPRTAYRQPQPTVPETWAPAAGSAGGSAPGSDLRLARWWDSFDDPLMSSLVSRAIAANPDIRTAVSRMREARATLASTRSTLRPAVDVAPSVGVSGSGSRDGAAQSYQVGLDVSWEIDVLGGTRSAIDASSATAGARDADLDDVLVSVVAETAIDYITVRANQQRLRIAEDNKGLQSDALDLTRLRTQAGLATELDVQQALSSVESTRAQLAVLRAQLEQSRHALAALLGLTPSALDAELSSPAAVPAAPLDIAVGIPAEAIRRRPDVRSAEQQLAAQYYQRQAAQADLGPTFRLAGSIGLESLSFLKTFLPGASFWNIRPSASWRLFNREQLRQTLTIQTERQEQATTAYESRVVDALREVEDALTALAQEEERRRHLVEAVAAARTAATLSLQLYTSGLRDFRDVLDTQRSLLTLDDSLASSTATVSTNTVRLYKAVGGGWLAREGLSVAPTP